MPNDPWRCEPGQTPIDENERRDLIPSVFSRQQLNELELLNTNTARHWALSSRVTSRGNLLTESFVRELHRRMFSGVWRWAGVYRVTARNLGWEAHRIPEGVRTALDDAQYWFDHRTYPPHEAAIRLHHRLVLIHPWSNGNGRHARLLADALMNTQGQRELSWGGEKLDLPGIGRQRYIEALQYADRQDFGRLIEFCR